MIKMKLNRDNMTLEIENEMMDVLIKYDEITDEEQGSDFIEWLAEYALLCGETINVFKYLPKPMFKNLIDDIEIWQAEYTEA